MFSFDQTFKMKEEDERKTFDVDSRMLYLPSSVLKEIFGQNTVGDVYEKYSADDIKRRLNLYTMVEVGAICEYERSGRPVESIIVTDVKKGIVYGMGLDGHPRSFDLNDDNLSLIPGVRCNIKQLLEDVRKTVAAKKKADLLRESVEVYRKAVKK